MAKILVCHTETDCLTVGKGYRVIDENSYHFIVNDDNYDEHWFTKELDEEGLSYKTWFTLVDTEEECNNG